MIQLIENLNSFASQIIEDVPENYNFRINPDDIYEHDPAWHQYGILSHSIEAYYFYNNELDVILKKWQFIDFIQEALNKSINGRSKKNLLEFAIILHDIGKFQRSFKTTNGLILPDYDGHEEKSEKIILDESKLINQTLKLKFHLDYAQIKYIAICAGLHYELAKIRKEAYKNDVGFSLNYIDSESCASHLQDFLLKHKEYQIEIGLLFLCDNMAKTNIRIEARSDNDISMKSNEIVYLINQNNLHPNLIKAIKQLPVSMYLVYKYLSAIKENYKII